MAERYKMEYVNSEVSTITDTYENHELTAEELTDRLNQQDNDLRKLKRLYCKCCDCEHADLYVPHYTYPHFNPRCELTGNSIKPEDTCENFELIGRLSR